MFITEIRTRNFRNLADEKVEFFDGINVLTGNNAQGKTSVLEAISILGNLHSFRTRRLREVIRFGEKNSDIFGKFTRSGVEDELLIRIDGLGRRIIRSGKQVKDIAEVLGCFPVSSFSPDDIDIIKGGSLVRRRFLDKGCITLFRHFFENHRAYYKALLSRNRIIKTQGVPEDDLLKSYESVMAVSGIELTKMRRSLVNILRTSIRRKNFLENKGAIVDIKYKSGIYSEKDVAGDEDEYRRLLFDKRSIDFQRGFTTIGPHRDDFVIMIDGHPAREFASQGQKRLLAISMLLSLIEETRKAENTPVLLLDDVSSELDSKNRRELYNELSRIGGQILLTTTDSSLYEEIEIPIRIYHVETGRCTIKMERNI